jgi:hypothetical protein
MRYWSWYGAGATGVGWELWRLGLDQYVGAGAATTDDLERWRLTGSSRLDQFRAFWQRKFDALETEIARGKRNRRSEKSTERKLCASRKSG